MTPSRLYVCRVLRCTLSRESGTPDPPGDRHAKTGRSVLIRAQTPGSGAGQTREASDAPPDAIEFVLGMGREHPVDMPTTQGTVLNSLMKCASHDSAFTLRTTPLGVRRHSGRAFAAPTLRRPIGGPAVVQVTRSHDIQDRRRHDARHRGDVLLQRRFGPRFRCRPSARRSGAGHCAAGVELTAVQSVLFGVAFRGDTSI